ncbi:DUF4082 domain-containing protein [Actinokineospora enzanensis]|uniref:DUF4082 domain-containing protein n=1 Tax=Actinokineospora enzanensis TaxID=155975 RepID=UPI00037EAB48|nr:DUF4082 domain-containing protein [Actinokineospora enzanensis]
MLRRLLPLVAALLLLPLMPGSASASRWPYLIIDSQWYQRVLTVGEPITLTGSSYIGESGDTTQSMISVDDGRTWTHFDHGGRWSLEFTPDAVGAFKVLTQAAMRSDWADVRTDYLRVGPATPPGPVDCPCTFTSPPKAGSPVITSSDQQLTELGLRFYVDREGTLPYYTAGNLSETSRGALYDWNGEIVARSVYNRATARFEFATPVHLESYHAYTLAYQADFDEYLVAENYFTETVTQGPITAMHDATGGAGVYAYRNMGETVMPANVYLDSDYLISPTFIPA